MAKANDTVNINLQALDKIIKETLSAVEKSKTQIYDIYEAARAEVENVRKDLERVKQQTLEIIVKVDELEKRERNSRIRLMEVSRNFAVYSEEDIKQAYIEASNAKAELAVAREHEVSLRHQRDILELRLRSLAITAEKAERLVSQVGVVLDYLGREMDGVVTKIETLQQRQALGARIIAAQEEERRRMAREIHDGPAQALANVVLRAEVCERLISTDAERARAELRDLQEQVRGVLKETRKVIFDLRPMTLDDLGLTPTVRRIVDSFRERTGVNVDFRVLGQERRLPAHIEIGVFRIVQEALTNTEKHAAAKMVRVRLDFRHEQIAALIEDDGKGFAAEADAGGKESFGLMGMRERVNLLNGVLTISSEPGKGTRIYVRIPLEA